jgi:ubiquinone/menaquinone biosynthesis C-methylase UbiE
MVAGEIQKRILDYGQGKGKDVEWLREHIQGYDPYWKNTPEVLIDNFYDVVLNNYVLNVVQEDVRHSILEDIKRVLKPCGYAYISVRDVSEKVVGEPYKDGVITKTGTFQKLFSHEELEKLLQKYFDEVKVLSKKAPLLAKVKKACREV